MFGYHLKLHPGILYSHPSSTTCWVPTLKSIPAKSLQASVHLTYAFADSSHDWCYPFDLCAGIYRLADVFDLLTICTEIHGPNAIGNPNQLEFYFNKTFWSSSLSQKYKAAACCSSPKVCVITVNRVQHTYDVPIYTTNGGDIASLNALLPVQRDIVGDCGIDLHCSRELTGQERGDEAATSTSPSPPHAEVSIPKAHQDIDALAYLNAEVCLSCHVGDLHFLSSKSCPVADVADFSAEV